jgi:hypothetical protein
VGDQLLGREVAPLSRSAPDDPASIALAVLLSAGIVLVPAAARSGDQRASLPDVGDEVMCTICGTLLQESSRRRPIASEL